MLCYTQISVASIKNHLFRAYRQICFRLQVGFQTSLVAQMVKRLPTMQETRVQSLCREDLLEKEMATHSSTLAWKIRWMEKPGRLQSIASQRVGHDWATSLSQVGFRFTPHFSLPLWTSRYPGMFSLWWKLQPGKWEYPMPLIVSAWNWHTVTSSLFR